MKTLPQSQPPSVQIVCCPNCGKEAERRYWKQQQVMETSCYSCDYLLVNSNNGDVLEAYAPGIAA